MLTLTIFSVATRCLGFIYKIYLAKIMSTTELGIYNITLSIYMVLLTIVGSSIPITISKITARNKNLGQNNYTHYSVTSSLILNIFLALVIALFAVISRPLITMLIGASEGYSTILALLPSIFFTAIYSQLRGYLWGIENYFAVSIVEFIEQILKITLCIVLIISNLFSSPIMAVANAMNISCGLSTLLGIWLYFRNSGKFKYKNGYFKEIIRSSAPLTGVRLFGSLLQPAVSILIPFRLASEVLSRTEILSELGILMGMSMPLLSIPSTIIGALCMILIPKISCNNTRQVNKEINYYVLFTISCIFIFIPTFIVLGKPICELVFHNSQAGIYISSLCWTIIPIGLAQITTSILNALNQEYRTFLYFVISNLIMLVFTIIFTPIIGAGIIIVGMGLGSILTTILNINKIKKILGTKTNIIKLIIEHMLVSLPVILITKFVHTILRTYISPFFAIALTGCISVIAFICLLLVFDILNLSSIKGYLSRGNKTSTSTTKCSNAVHK